MSTTPLPFSSATAGSCLIGRANAKFCSETQTTTVAMMVKSASFPLPLATGCRSNRRAARKTVFCKAAPASASASLDEEKGASVSGSSEVQEQEEQVNAKIGAKVRVKVPLKIYHVPRVPEIDLTGMEGVLNQYVGLWKGKRISANLPYKVEFVKDVEGRGRVKFFAHLREDEFEYLD